MERKLGAAFKLEAVESNFLNFISVLSFNTCVSLDIAWSLCLSLFIWETGFIIVKETSQDCHNPTKLFLKSLKQWLAHEDAIWMLNKSNI